MGRTRWKCLSPGTRTERAAREEDKESGAKSSLADDSPRGGGGGARTVRTRLS